MRQLLALFSALVSLLPTGFCSAAARANELTGSDRDPRNIQIQFEPIEYLRIRKGKRLAFPENSAPIARQVRVYGHAYECTADYSADTDYGQGVADGRSHVIDGNETHRFWHESGTDYSHSGSGTVGWVYRIGFTERNLFSTNGAVTFTCSITVKDDQANPLEAPAVTARVLVDAFPEVGFYLRSDLI